MRATTRRRVCVLYWDATLFGDGHDGQFTVYMCSYLIIITIIVLVQEYMERSKWDWPFQFNAACCCNSPFQGFSLLLYSMSFMLSAGQAIMGDTEMSPVHGETKTTGWHFQELNMYYTHSAELNKTRSKK